MEDVAFFLHILGVTLFVAGIVVARAPAIPDVALVWVWVGVAVWMITFAAMTRRGLQLARGEHPPLSAGRLEELAPSQRPIQ